MRHIQMSVVVQQAFQNIDFALVEGKEKLQILTCDELKLNSKCLHFCLKYD